MAGARVHGGNGGCRLQLTIVRLIHILAGLAWLGGYASAQTAPAGPDQAEALRQAAQFRSAVAAGPYILQSGDDIEIRVYNLQELNHIVKVRPDGKISLILLNDIPAAGLTPEALAEEIAKGYSSQYRDPKVAVIVRSFSNRSVFVGGEVTNPQQITLEGRLTASAAIFRAGGIKEFAASDRILLVRGSGSAEPRVETFSLQAIVNGKQDFELQPFDLVYVPRSMVQVYVGGEVSRPGLVALQGDMTTLQAVLQAGGALRTGKTNEILLLRKSSSDKPLLVRLDLRKVLNGEQDQPLHAFDVVFVPKTKIATVNQFVEQYIRNVLPLYLNAGFNYLFGSTIF
jgi:polysaccharide biosynthesis/export protein